MNQKKARRRGFVADGVYFTKIKDKNPDLLTCRLSYNKKVNRMIMILEDSDGRGRKFYDIKKNETLDDPISSAGQRLHIGRGIANRRYRTTRKSIINDLPEMANII